MSNIEEAVKRVDDTINKSWLSRIPGNAEFVISDEYGAGHSVTIDDLRTLLAVIEADKAEIVECHTHIKACAEENERLRNLIAEYVNTNLGKPMVSQDELFQRQTQKDTGRMTSRTVDGVKTGLIVRDPKNTNVCDR